jgi:branched-subunit amino acid aminotransferase/4-amino-4-deoxychorismate lyase
MECRTVTEPLVYLNGELLPASQAHLAIYDAGIVLGATVTDQTRTFHQRPFRLADHLDRFMRALRYARMDVGLSQEELTGISNELIARNSRLLEMGDELGLIHFVTPGEYRTYASGPARATPTVCAHTFVLPFELWARKMQNGAHLVTPSIRHLPPQSLDPKMKVRSRMHFYLADKEAQLVDPEASALLLDIDGNVAETSTANFLMVERGTIISPTTRNTLPGVSRATVIDLAAELGISFVERDIQVFTAVNADEAFLASTPYCLMPVTRINGTAIADGKPGPIYRRLLDAWSRLVGLNIEQQIVEGASRRQAAKGPYGTC